MPSKRLMICRGPRVPATVSNLPVARMLSMALDTQTIWQLAPNLASARGSSRQSGRPSMHLRTRYLEIMHAKLCAQQLWSPDQPAQKLMRHSTFARALVALAAKAYPDEPSATDKLESLLSHIARADEGE